MVLLGIVSVFWFIIALVLGIIYSSQDQPKKSRNSFIALGICILFQIWMYQREVNYSERNLAEFEESMPQKVKQLQKNYKWLNTQSAKVQDDFVEKKMNAQISERFQAILDSADAKKSLKTNEFSMLKEELTQHLVEQKINLGNGSMSSDRTFVEIVLIRKLDENHIGFYGYISNGNKQTTFNGIIATQSNRVYILDRANDSSMLLKELYAFDQEDDLVVYRNLKNLTPSTRGKCFFWTSYGRPSGDWKYKMRKSYLDDITFMYASKMIYKYQLNLERGPIDMQFRPYFTSACNWKEIANRIQF